MFKKRLLALTLGGLVVAGLPACATRGFVRTRVATVNTKVETLTQSVEETQERTQNEGAITDVDRKALAAQTAADQSQAATTAGTPRWPARRPAKSPSN
jgi:outer membrane murein-binding lipoprotein Lpp